MPSLINTNDAHMLMASGHSSNNTNESTYPNTAPTEIARTEASLIHNTSLNIPAPSTLAASPNHRFDSQYNCRSVITQLSYTNKTDNNYFKQLCTMYIGHRSELLSKVDSLCQDDDSDVRIRKIKPTKATATKEVIRRFKYLKLAKRVPVTTHWKLNQCMIVLCSEEYSLPSHEIQYLETEMNHFISFHANNLESTKKHLQELGADLLKNDRQKMRLWEAFFSSEKHIRDKLIKLRDSKTRVHIDANNSPQEPTTLYEEVASKYNDIEWVPFSRTLSELYTKLKKPIRLTLIAGEELTDQQCKVFFCSAKGAMNKAMFNWKKSGNGSGNLRQTKRISGMTYEEETENVVYVEDDRLSFVSHLHIAYFWSLAEITGLTDHISQNCSMISMNTSDGNAINSPSTSSKVQGRRSANTVKAKKQKLEEQCETLVSMASRLENRLDEQGATFKLSSKYTCLLDETNGCTKLENLETDLFFRLDEYESKSDAKPEMINHLKHRLTSTRVLIVDAKKRIKELKDELEEEKLIVKKMKQRKNVDLEHSNKDDDDDDNDSDDDTSLSDDSLDEFSVIASTNMELHYTASASTTAMAPDTTSNTSSTAKTL